MMVWNLPAFDAAASISSYRTQMAPREIRGCCATLVSFLIGQIECVEDDIGTFDCCLEVCQARGIALDDR